VRGVPLRCRSRPGVDRHRVRRPEWPEEARLREEPRRSTLPRQHRLKGPRGGGVATKVGLGYVGVNPPREEGVTERTIVVGRGGRRPWQPRGGRTLGSRP
jgi:hypothetical protein